MIAHPGKITYVNEDTGTTEVVDVSLVPEGLRFASTPGGFVPIVRVVASTSGDKRTIREYCTKGQMVRSTIQLKQPPR